jgi:septal ring factor EnvC (AmiA/AmiB activator)
LAARSAQVAANKTAAENAGQQLVPMVKELEVAQAAATQAGQTVATLSQQLPALEQSVKAAQEQLAAAQKTMTDVQAVLASAEASVKRWQDELAFAHKADNAQAAVTQ